MLSNNLTLPKLNPLAARSTYAILFGVVVSLFNAMGVDILAVFADMGLGATSDQVIATGQTAVGAVQQLLPILAGIWAWFERRAPNFRLSLWSK